MGKKKQKVMDAEKEIFLHGDKKTIGCIANGISETAANIIWAKMAKFAEYAFNKSHKQNCGLTW